MDSRYARTAAVWLVGLLLALLAAPAVAQPVIVTIQEPYLDLHSGPGRGYPVVYAVERGAEVELLQRRTDWYQLRTGRDVEGWVHRNQLERTLAHVDPGLRAAVLDRFITNRVVIGLSAGVLEEDPLLRIYGGYRIDERYRAELGISQVAGTYSSSTLLELSALYLPWPEKALLPHVSVGLGYFSNAPRQTLVDANDADGPVYSLGLGVSGRLEPRFGLRADYRYRYADFGGESEQFHEFTAGFVLHF